MGLRDLNFRSEKVETSGGDLVVRGLSLTDLTTLVRKHGAGLGIFFDIIVSASKAVALSDMSMLAGALAEAAPDAVAEAIALAAGDTDDESIALAKGMPFPDQIAVLEKIGEITFTTEGGPKKVLETVVRVARGATSALRDLKT